MKTSKLNKCKVCSSRKGLEAQFDITGKLYFLCWICAALDKQLFARFNQMVANLAAGERGR